MARFRKKPVVIEAALFDGDQVGDVTDGKKVLLPSCPGWFPSVVREVREASTEQPREGEVIRKGDKLLIGTLEGTHAANPGDWIIRGVQGEMYPCKPEIFEATYDQA